MAGCAAVLGGLIALAAAQADAPTDPRAAATAEPAAPSRELLLYLAEFGDAEDRHVDPAAIAEEFERDTDDGHERDTHRRSGKEDDAAAAPADR